MEQEDVRIRGATATYSPEDNKLRLYVPTRLDAATYERVKAAGFKWAPKQELFVAPMWTPAREDVLLELAGEIGDEDTSLVDRAEQRAERFEEYGEHRAADYEAAHRGVKAIADGIPFGQPILVGHHSERHARKDAERIENGMRRAVKMWETSQYWTARAKGAIRAAKYKELPAVRARRIKGLEADLRRQEKTKKECELAVRLWEFIDDNTKWKPKPDGSVGTPLERALFVAGRVDQGAYRPFLLAEYPRNPPASQYEGPMSLYSALGGGEPDCVGFITPEQARDLALKGNRGTIAWAERWIAHYNNRLAYERAMLEESGGTVADRTKPEKGGAVRCWTYRAGWSYIQKVNKVTVTVLDNWGNGGRDFTRTIPFDNLRGVMTAAEVQDARDTEQLVEVRRGATFVLRNAPVQQARPAHEQPEQATDCDAMKESLRAGVQVVSAPQLFPTPVELAERMVDALELGEGHRVLEPSAGTGRLIDATVLYGVGFAGLGTVVAVEHGATLAGMLRAKYGAAGLDVRCADFLECNGGLGLFDRIVMNPPFKDGEDIKHILHARGFLKPGGKLVALCANGPRQAEKLRPLADEWEELPADTFKEAGTGVRVVLLTMAGPRQPSELGNCTGVAAG